MKKIMKRISEFIEKLTLKQSKIITSILVICIILFIIGFWIVNNTILSVFFAVSSIILTPITYYMSVVVENKAFLEKEKMLRPKIRKEFDLDSKEFIEVIPLPTACEKWLTLRIEQNARFFVKEMKKKGEEEKIILVIKDENNKEIEEPIEVDNYFAFHNNFKLKK